MLKVNFRNMALVSCFPISSHGIMFALIEVFRIAFNIRTSDSEEGHQRSLEVTEDYNRLLLIVRQIVFKR